MSNGDAETTLASNKPGQAQAAIGLALSGGGSRAIAFHLGCLRELNASGILTRVKVVSTVSGGSVIGALYAANDGPFPDFEQEVNRVLRRGLVRPAIRSAFYSLEGARAAMCLALLAPVGLGIATGLVPNGWHRTGSATGAPYPRSAC